MSKQLLYRDAQRAALLGLLVNLLLGVVKLAGGLIGASYALLSDALNSLGDVLTSAVVLFALGVSQRPASDKHPYGYMRAEAVAGSNVAMLMIVSAILIGWEALQRITTQHGAPPSWTLWIAGVNVVIKECLYRYKVQVGRRTGSLAIVANAWDHRSDALCSSAVLFGLAIVRWGGPRWMWADEAAALVVVAAIIWTGLKLSHHSARELLDVQADDALVEELRRAAVSVPGVAGVEKLRVRKSGLEHFVDMHLEVDPNSTVAEGHRVGHLVKDRLLADFSTLRDVLVHLEPASSVSAATHRGAAPPNN